MRDILDMLRERQEENGKPVELRVHSYMIGKDIGKVICNDDKLPFDPGYVMYTEGDNFVLYIGMLAR